MDRCDRRGGPHRRRTSPATDLTGDFSVYPRDDLAVRTWAAKIAPTYP
ncbi:hypothetical protein ABZ079_28220 [Streptomyces sp. NPDC006314]